MKTKDKRYLASLCSIHTHIHTHVVVSLTHWWHLQTSMVTVYTDSQPNNIHQVLILLIYHAQSYCTFQAALSLSGWHSHCVLCYIHKTHIYAQAHTHQTAAEWWVNISPAFSQESHLLRAPGPSALSTHLREISDQSDRVAVGHLLFVPDPWYFREWSVSVRDLY